MFKSKFQFRPNTAGLIISKSTIDLANIQTEISQIPTFKKKLLYLYKQFYKLRNLQYNNQFYNGTRYEIIIRRNFKHISFNNRRNVILATTKDLTEEELVERTVNTLAFVFNGTVARRDPHIFEEIYNSQDLKQANIDTIEANILNTILRIDTVKPTTIKYDFKYRWYNQFRDDLKKIQDWNSITKNQLKQLKYPLDWMSFYQHETTIMRLNENLKLCL